MPCTTLITAREVKDWSDQLISYEQIKASHTDAKNPQMLVANKITAEMMKNGRLPHTFAPEAVKKVVKPIQNTPKPIMRLAAMSKLTWYFAAITPNAGVTIGPRLGTSARKLSKAKSVYLRGCYS